MRRLAVCLITVLAVLWPASAFAAAPLAQGELDVQAWPGGQPGASVVIISLTLPEKTALPATVRIPVPEGIELDWVGEITGVDPSTDPTRTYTVESGMGGSYVEYEISKSRVAQIEGTGPAPTVSGTKTSFSLDFVQTVPSVATAFSVRLPAGLVPSSVEPAQVGEPQKNESGESLYSLERLTLKPGDTQRIAVTYGPEGSSARKPTSAGTVALVLGGVALVAVVALVLVLSSQRRRRIDA